MVWRCRLFLLFLRGNLGGENLGDGAMPRGSQEAFVGMM
jgi:hypothetical protein